MILSYAKYSGCGNTFLFVDNRDKRCPTDALFIHHQCTHDSGADGMILLECSDCADFKMRIFNSDGSEAEMCGNGIRCLFSFIQSLSNQKQEQYLIETGAGIRQITARGDDVEVSMGFPTSISWNLPIRIDNTTHLIHYLDTGVPHAVLFVDHLDDIDIQTMGKKLRHHSRFSPKGANVNFATLLDSSLPLVRVRTYERGVEGETAACGTGATATALAAVAQYQLPQTTIYVMLQSQEKLKIQFCTQDNQFRNVTMCGPTKYLGSGTLQ